VRDYVENAYRLLLRRDPEAEALEWATGELETGGLSRAGLLAELIASDEFGRLRAIDDAVALATRARIHGAALRGLTAPPATDERLIEIPWVLSRYKGEPRVLDAGYANADASYLTALVEAAPAEIVGIDPIPRDVHGIRGVAGDLRALPFDDASFDVAFCVSTIEHVGRDNRVYGADAERDESGIPQALRELCRVASRILLTVPTGASEDHGWFVQLDVGAWRELFADAALGIVEDEAYELDAGGWHTSSDEGAGLRYGERGPAASAVYCVELHGRAGDEDSGR
jgi:SAM-dependent methyltransferase